LGSVGLGWVRLGSVGFGWVGWGSEGLGWYGLGAVRLRLYRVVEVGGPGGVGSAQWDCASTGRWRREVRVVWAPRVVEPAGANRDGGAAGEGGAAPRRRILATGLGA